MQVISFFKILKIIETALPFLTLNRDIYMWKSAQSWVRSSAGSSLRCFSFSLIVGQDLMVQQCAWRSWNCIPRRLKYSTVSIWGAEILSPYPMPPWLSDSALLMMALKLATRMMPSYSKGADHTSDTPFTQFLPVLTLNFIYLPSLWLL